MTFLIKLLLVINVIILPYLYSNIKQIIYITQQYCEDIQNFKNITDNNEIISQTGQFYQKNIAIIIYNILVLIIVIIQFTYLLYIIKYSFIKNRYLIFITLFAFILSVVLPLFLLFSYFYKPEFIGNIIFNTLKNIINKETYFLNYVGIISILSICYILGTSLYLFIFNKINYICIFKKNI